MALLFDESYYINAKLEQLHAKGEMDASGKPYTMESLVKAISDAGLTPYSHYTQYGCREGLDPSSTFDQSYYLASKLAQLRSTGEVDADGNAYTMASLTATLAAQGMSPPATLPAVRPGRGPQPQCLVQRKRIPERQAGPAAQHGRNGCQWRSLHAGQPAAGHQRCWHDPAGAL